ncbi:MAG: hypothetical protein KGL39_20480 [Patescibacteria group bacterium]|nr:hypothetical protein [Patescibacteria group bacterium]
MKITIERLQSGCGPSARERWHCFYRLFRLARKADEAAFQGSSYSCTDQAAVDALRLLGYRRWIDLCVGVDQIDYMRIGLGPIRYSLGKQLLRHGIAREQRKRLYGMDDEFVDELLPKDQAVRQEIVDLTGRELTVLEAAEERHKVLRRVRRCAANHGIHFPEGPGSDAHVLRRMRTKP